MRHSFFLAWLLTLCITAVHAGQIGGKLPAGTTADTQSQGTSNTTVSTTAYTDTAITNAIAAVNPAVAVVAASTAKLPNSPIYANGVAGIGATITTATTNTALVQDGHTMLIGERLLVKNEGDSGGLGAAKNGVYYVTTIQSLGVAWILTRVLDYDQPSDINNTGAIPVISGTANGTTQWVTSSSITTVGTDAITFAQFTYAPSTLATTSNAIALANGMTATTQSAGDNSTKLSTTAYADAAGVSPLLFRNVGAAGFYSGSTSPSVFGVGSLSHQLSGGSNVGIVVYSSKLVDQLTINAGIGNYYSLGSTINSASPTAVTLKPIFCAEMGVSSTATQRTYLGLSAGTMRNSDTGPNNTLAFRYSTGASDTTIQAIAIGSTGTTTTVDTTVALDTTKTQQFKIDLSDGANAKFYIDGTLRATISTNLPASGTVLGANMETINLSAGASYTVYSHHLYVETN